MASAVQGAYNGMDGEEDSRGADALNGGAAATADASSSSGADDAEPFIKGVGLHIWQGSGDEASNWTAALRSWAPSSWLRFAPARLQGGLTVLEAAPDFWNRYEEDAELAASLGCNGFRLSLEWSRIEPRQGFIDSHAVARYRAIFAALQRRGIQPNVTLMHFTTPAWFEQIGGWAVEANVQLFVHYAVQAVQLFGDQVQLWATLNEPTSAATMGYVFGAYPPGEVLQLKKAGAVLLNMLRGHTAAYRAIKALPGGGRHRVGLAHMVIPFTAWPDLGPLTAPARFAAKWLTFWWGYDLMHEWLLMGKFSWCVPSIAGGGRRCVFEVADPRPPLDWFGLNYYSRPHVSPLLTPGRKPWQVLSDLGYPIDAEGMHLVLVRSAAYGVPVYVTETGVSIASQRHRCFMVDAYVKEILRGLHEGVDVRGIYYWTLVDNFEWNAGYSIKFGLYEWSPWPWGKDRAPRAAAGTLKELYARLPPSVGGVRQAVRRMDLEHAALVPPPRSIVWWLGTAVLLYLQLLEWLCKGVQLLLQLLGIRRAVTRMAGGA